MRSAPIGASSSQARAIKRERVLGDYRIVAELARGGMGKVYLARRFGQAGFERLFAVKVMNQQLSEDHDARLMLLDEAHIASRLHHPNVVGVIDIGIHDDGYYLVMDYVEGCSLQQLLRSSATARPPRLIIPILLDTLRGLHAVHTLCNANGEPYSVVHRDVSPHNLLVGLDGTCRVTDFGIAKARERFTDTQAGVYKGKLAFMAPEQLRGTSPVDCRADVWAAGVTLYLALTGEHPFRGKNDGATLNHVLTAELKPPSEIGLHPPACFDDVIMRALERDPDARYQSAEELGDALRRIALAEDFLGSASEVAHWVEASYGHDLSERRRRIADLPKSETETGTGSTTSVPRLWFSSDQVGGTGTGSKPDTTHWDLPRTSWIATSLHKPGKLGAVLVLLFAIVGGGLAALSTLDAESAAVPIPPPLPARSAPAVAPSPAPAAAAPMAQSPTETRPTPAEPPPERIPKLTRPSALAPDSPPARPRASAPRVRAEPAARAAPEPARESLRQESAATEHTRSEPTPPRPAAVEAPSERPLERNPYVLGE